MTKTKAAISLLLNCLTAVITVYIIILLFFIEDPVLNNGWESFMFFTTDANLLTAVVAVIIAVYDIRILRGKAVELPKYAELLKYVCVVSLMLTFVTVMCFLVPLYGSRYELGRTNCHMHFSAPMMTLFSFLFCECRSKISLRESLWGLLPTAVYGLVYYVMVVAVGEENGGWKDFYTFNEGGRWLPVFIAVLAVTFGICQLVRLFCNLKLRRDHK